MTLPVKILLGLIGLLISSITLHAAETSRSQVLGFSKDGRYFAFEEFGLTDAVGSPYSSVYVIDTSDDSWVKGTPLRENGGEEDGHAIERKTSELGLTDRFDIALQYEKALTRMRQKRLKKAGSVLSKIGPLYPGSKRVSNPPFEFSTDGRSVRFSLQDYQQVLNDGTQQKVWKLYLEETKFPAVEKCFGLYETTVGYTLKLYNENDGATKVLNNDARVPGSRGCAQGYRIEEVWSFKGAGDHTTLAILLRYSKPGFEGLDGRLLAVTTQLTK